MNPTKQEEMEIKITPINHQPYASVIALKPTKVRKKNTHLTKKKKKRK